MSVGISVRDAALVEVLLSLKNIQEVNIVLQNDHGTCESVTAR